MQDNPSTPVCRFCHGSGRGPTDTRDPAARVAAVAAVAAGNQVWDWSGRPRRRGGVTVEASLAQRLADAVRALDLDGDQLDAVLRRVTATHGRRTAQQVIAHLGRIPA